METFGERMRHVRARRNISGAELARRLGVQEKRVSNWEMNRHEPPFQMVREICKQLRTHPSYLFGFTDDISASDLASPDWLEMVEGRLAAIEKQLNNR